MSGNIFKVNPFTRRTHFVSVFRTYAIVSFHCSGCIGGVILFDCSAAVVMRVEGWCIVWMAGLPCHRITQSQMCKIKDIFMPYFICSGWDAESVRRGGKCREPWIADRRGEKRGITQFADEVNLSSLFPLGPSSCVCFLFVSCRKQHARGTSYRSKQGN